jgi:hypothetical protein
LEPEAALEHHYLSRRLQLLELTDYVTAWQNDKEFTGDHTEFADVCTREKLIGILEGLPPNPQDKFRHDILRKRSASDPNAQS